MRQQNSKSLDGPTRELMTKAALLVIRDTLAAIVVLVLASVILSVLAFPFGGGVYHFVFAYSDGGRLQSALFAYAVLVLVPGATAWALLTVGLSVRWWVCVGLAIALGGAQWLGIATYEGASPGFRRIAMAQLVMVVPVVLGVTWPAIRECRRAHRAGTTYSPSRTVRRWAYFTLGIPYLGVFAAVLAFAFGP